MLMMGPHHDELLEVDVHPDADMAGQYRREAARLRALAQSATFAEVRQDLTAIAQEYEALATQRDDADQRYGHD